MTLPLCKMDLIQQINQGLSPKFLFFWGHQPNKKGEIGKYCFSQWFSAPFRIEETTYLTAEHFMMAEKARLFEDQDSLQKILTAQHPGEAKLLGRHVRHFDEKLWLQHRLDIAYRGNMAKFSQHLLLRDFLVTTANRVLVEASPVDSIWGIGLNEEHPDAGKPAAWPGLNLLGFVLMKVRASLL
jgi:ribA/ribD-fused uncharacterized protein